MLNFFQDRPSFKSLKDKKNLVGVEIGVMGGKNAADMLLNLDIKTLYLIDPFCNYGSMQGHGMLNDNKLGEECYQATVKRMGPFGDKVIIIRETSLDAKDLVPNYLDFVYIDGNHRHAFVAEDIQNYNPKVIEGGQTAGHDFKNGEPGVQKAVREYFGNNFKLEYWDWWHIKEKMNEPNKQTFARLT